MKVRLCLASFALVLAGCASTSTVVPVPQTPQQTVFAIKAAHAVALRGAVAYRELPECSPTRSAPCSDPAIVTQAQKANAAANTTLDAAENAVRTPGVDATARERAIAAAQAALAALQALFPQLIGVR
jgi:hypothetical protein